MAFSVEKNEDIVVITLKESVFIRHQVRLYQEILKDAKSSGVRKLVLDLGNCEYVSSEGLGAVAETWRFFEEEEFGVMALVLNTASGNEVSYLFEIIGLTQVMEGHIFQVLESAISFLKKLPESKQP